MYSAAYLTFNYDRDALPLGLHGLLDIGPIWNRYSAENQFPQ
jgi:hypothetical protein